MAIGDVVTYGDVAIGVVKKDINYRIKELKQKIVDGVATPEEIEELKLLKE